MARIGIVIVNYNGEAYQNDCIRTLYNQNYKDFMIVVVDSASEDNSIDLLAKEYPEVHILCQKENVGVAAGNNIGIRYCMDLGAEYILLLNNDTELSPDLLSILINEADRNTVVVPKIYFFDHKDCIWFGGGYLDWKKASAVHRGIREIDQGQYNIKEKINYSPTCCMLLHRSIFDEVGYIDEKTFMYFDDTDLCARLEDANISILYVPRATMWHKVSSASGGIQSKIGIYYNSRNQLYYMKKYSNKIRLVNKCTIIFKSLVKAVISPLRNKNEKYILIAYWDYLHGNMGRKDFNG